MKGKSNEKDNKNNMNDNKWAWKKIPTKSGNLHIKEMNSKVYNLCKWYKAWVIHDLKTTSGPTACILYLLESNNYNTNAPNQLDPSPGPSGNEQIQEIKP